MRIGLTILALFFYLFPLTSQVREICITVCDIDSKLSISDVYVFLADSEYGNSTSLDGTCKLTIPNNINQELILSHISYNTKTIPSRLYDKYLNCDTVYLQLQKVDIAEIEIKSKRQKKWYKQLKKFTKSFIGTSRAATKCEILNPEILHFKETEKVFLATAKGMLEIRNEYLGYDIKFLLTEFRIESDGSSRYQGKAKFTDISTAENIESYKKNREKTFDRSPKHFYQALIYNFLEDSEYEIKLEKLENNNFSLLSEPNATDLVEYKPYSNSFYLRFIEFLTIIDKSHKVRIEKGKTSELGITQQTRFNNATTGEETKLLNAISYIFKISPYLEIDIYGNLLNPEKLREYGYWASQRLADQLPYHFGDNYVDEHVRQLKLKTSASQNQKSKSNNSASPSKDTIINGFILNKLLIPLKDIKYGGVKKDGIPAINSPSYSDVQDIDFMEESDELILVKSGNNIKAYPLKILDRHEIVNDGNLIITYCPLCHSGIVFDISKFNLNTSFGVSGLLYQSDVLMYDRKTNSLWSQIEGRSIAGSMSGTELDIVPSFYISWKNIKLYYPNAQILDIPSNNKQSYASQLYANYKNSDRLMFPVKHHNAELDNKMQVIGISLGKKSVAIPLDKIINAQDGVKYILSNTILNIDYHNGEIRVFDSDQNPILFQQMYWFAWYTFHPETDIYKK